MSESLKVLLRLPDYYEDDMPSSYYSSPQDSSIEDNSSSSKDLEGEE